MSLADLGRLVGSFLSPLFGKDAQEKSSARQTPKKRPPSSLSRGQSRHEPPRKRKTSSPSPGALSRRTPREKDIFRNADEVCAHTCDESGHCAAVFRQPNQTIHYAKLNRHMRTCGNNRPLSARLRCQACVDNNEDIKAVVESIGSAVASRPSVDEGGAAVQPPLLASRGFVDDIDMPRTISVPIEKHANGRLQGVEVNTESLVRLATNVRATFLLADTASDVRAVTQGLLCKDLPSADVQNLLGVTRSTVHRWRDRVKDDPYCGASRAFEQRRQAGYSTILATALERVQAFVLSQARVGLTEKANPHDSSEVRNIWYLPALTDHRAKINIDRLFKKYAAFCVDQYCAEHEIQDVEEDVHEDVWNTLKSARTVVGKDKFAEWIKGCWWIEPERFRQFFCSTCRRGLDDLVKAGIMNADMHKDCDKATCKGDHQCSVERQPKSSFTSKDDREEFEDRLADLNDIRESVRLYELHVELKDNQYTVYKHMQTILELNQMMVVFDFMPWLEDIRLQMSLSEMRKCHECLIVVCLWKDRSGSMQSFTFNYFGGYVGSGNARTRVKADHYFVRNALDTFFREDFVQQFDEFFFWSDTGPGHFLTQRSLGYLLERIPAAFPYIEVLEWNFFGEQHGKCRADMAGSNAKRSVKTVAMDGKNVVGVPAIVNTLNEVCEDTQYSLLLSAPDRSLEHGVQGLTYMRGANAHHQFRIAPGTEHGKQDEYVLLSRRMSEKGEWTEQTFKFKE